MEVEPDNLHVLIQNMHHKDWKTRFDAGFRLGVRAGELGVFAETLQSMALDQRCPGKHTAAWLLRQFGRKTMQQWSNDVASLLCPTCFVFSRVQQIKLSRREPIIYCGCPVCGQSQQFVEVDHVLGVLDRSMPSKFSQQGRTIRVNWICHRHVFDFDSVEIVQASDEDVERFAVQAGNDTDPVRKPAYPKIPCHVSCQLSKNTLRILQHTFETVQIA